MDGSMLPGVLEKILVIYPMRLLAPPFRGLCRSGLFAWLDGGSAGRISKRISTGGVDMSEVATLEGAEPRTILQKLIAKNITAIVSYLSKGKWHIAKVRLAELGACRLCVELVPSKKPHPINIQPDQPVGVSVKYGYGKFIFEAKVISLEPSADKTGGGTIVLEVPDRIEVVQRRAFFRVDVPTSLKVVVLIWHRRQQDADPSAVEGDLDTGGWVEGHPGRYWQGRLVDVSAGGAQIVIDACEEDKFHVGQFIGVRFTPMPYERPLMFSAQIRNILPTADGKNLCLGVQIVGLEASLEGREVLSRLVGVVESYYQMNRGGLKQHDFNSVRTAT